LSQVESKLAEMGLTLPSSPAPVANYVRAIRTGNLIFVAGHGPNQAGYQCTGKVGADVSVEQAYEAARMTMLNCLASLKAEIGDLDRVTRVVKLLGMVNAVPEFTQHPQVINGASDLLTALYGSRGRHARSAVGMGSLPSQISVEIEMIVEVD
jgi:enamine deaminase RidA (YjgF/YER057c/UK114 family)